MPQRLRYLVASKLALHDTVTALTGCRHPCRRTTYTVTEAMTLPTIRSGREQVPLMHSSLEQDENSTYVAFQLEQEFQAR